MTLSGDWHNQLGSKMTLTADGKGGLSGKYNSAVGEAEDYYVLTGRYDTDAPEAEGVSVGWVVTFHNRKLNAHSTATWSGQYFFDNAVERIVTHWHKTSSTAPNNVWESTNVGHDTFVRDKPSIDEIAKSQTLTVSLPHPEDILATK